MEGVWEMFSMSLCVVSLPHVSAACRAEPQTLVSPGLHKHRAALQSWELVKATSGCQTPPSAGWRGTRGATQSHFSSKGRKGNGVCCLVPITGFKEISWWFFPINGPFTTVPAYPIRMTCLAPPSSWVSFFALVPGLRVVAMRFSLNLSNSGCISLTWTVNNAGWSSWMIKGVVINPIEGTQNCFFNQNRVWSVLHKINWKTQLLLLCNLNAPTNDCQNVSIKGIKSLHWIMKGLYPRSCIPHLCLS